MWHVIAELQTEVICVAAALRVCHLASDISFSFSSAVSSPACPQTLPSVSTQLLRVEIFSFVSLKKKGIRKGYLFPSQHFNQCFF